MKTIISLVEDVKAVLDYKGIPYPEDNDTIIELEITNAIGTINRCRRFTPTNDILYDEIYEDKIIPLVEAAFSKVGAEGETAHSENGTNRSYGSADKYPKDMLRDIVPLTKWV